MTRKIRKLIQNETDLLKAAISFRVKTTPLRKILAGKRVSKYFIKKLYLQLKVEKDPNVAFFNSPMVKKLLSIYSLYELNGTLSKVAQNLGLSRERVRQLLNKGTKLGLFDYQGIKEKRLPNIPKEKIIEDYRRLLYLREVAKINKISGAKLSELIHSYQITKNTLDVIRKEGERLKCIHQYVSLVQQSGHHLSSFELQKTQQGHYLSYKIIRFWGSIHTFRRELHIPFLPHNGKPLNGGGLEPGRNNTFLSEGQRI
ncbi:MAG: sigma factor-like helix-turn-helix DNA-binding protein [Nitrospiria bacterium]